MHVREAGKYQRAFSPTLHVGVSANGNCAAPNEARASKIPTICVKKKTFVIAETNWKCQMRRFYSERDKLWDHSKIMHQK
mmetsp:Transcript_22762/g.37702  ORF Transcript_22762/g.37702 Transcript_22762/m.37702 type:complete len:80 (-) Transcript_22762:117-356(-)